MGADSVLVNAALKLGMARVPGDNAEIFNKQYEGLIAYHKASSEAAVEAVKLGGIMAQKGVTAIQEGIKDRKTRKADADYQARDKASLFSKEGWKKGAVEVRRGNKAAREKIKQEDTETREWAAGKKQKLQDTTDILYGNKRKKKKGSKASDVTQETPGNQSGGKPDEFLSQQQKLDSLTPEQRQKLKVKWENADNLFKQGTINAQRNAEMKAEADRELDTKIQESSYRGQAPSEDEKKGSGSTDLQGYHESAEVVDEEEGSDSDGGAGSGGSGGGGEEDNQDREKSGPTKKLSPFKEKEEQTKPISRNISKPSGTSVSAPVESSIPSAGEMDNTIEQMVTDVAVDGITKTNDHYMKGGGMNDAHFEAADAVMTNMKNEIYNIINQKSISPEDIKYKSKVQKDATQFRQSLVDMKGLVVKTAQAYTENHVNADLSFIGFPNEQLLLKQVMDPKADLPKLGIKTYWKEGELYYDCGDSQMFREYASNSGIEINEEAPEAQPTKTIAASKLFGMVVLKDLKTENDINGVINKAGEDAIATLGNTKKLINPDFSRVEASLKNDFRNILEAKDANLQDIFTRDIMIGTTKRNYKKDLQANPEINALTYADLGLTDSIDENGDGILSSDELTDSDKAVIIETLTSPRTSGQIKAAIKNAEDYFLLFAQLEYNHMKNINKSESLLAEDLIAKYNKA